MSEAPLCSGSRVSGSVFRGGNRFIDSQTRPLHASEENETRRQGSCFVFPHSCLVFRGPCSVFHVSCFVFPRSCFAPRVSGSGLRAPVFGFRVYQRSSPNRFVFHVPGFVFRVTAFVFRVSCSG